MILKTFTKWKWIFVGLYLAAMALGVCLMIWPDISAGILCYLLGIILIIVGTLRMLSYFQRGISALWHRYELPLGLMDILLGIYFFSRPANVLILTPVIVGILILTDSVFKLQEILELRPGTQWLHIVLCIVNILFALLLIGNPFEGTMTLMVYLGLCLSIDSVQSLLFIRRVAKQVRQYAPIDADFVTIE